MSLEDMRQAVIEMLGDKRQIMTKIFGDIWQIMTEKLRNMGRVVTELFDQTVVRLVCRESSSVQTSDGWSEVY